MSDIKHLLDRTARSAAAPPSAEVVEADLGRGRAALDRRRRRRATAFSAAGTFAAAAILAGSMLVSGGGEDRLASPGAGSEQGSTSQVAESGVRLVSYTGEQLEGFVVEQVPEGWELQGSNEFRLTIAPEGDSTSPDAFTGKLVVMLLSSSAEQELPEGEAVQVGGHAGVVSHGDAADTLTYEDGEGHLVQVQAWRSTLGWSNEQLVDFAEGVTVTGDAKAAAG